RFGYSFPQ
ncbi:signal peptidase I, partial [Chlamydia psittaci C1/97]